MSRVGSLMTLGRQAMANSQTALQTTSHNISNANTEGYTRQRVEQKANPPVSTGNYQIGTGARVSGVERIGNDFLTKQIQGETNKMGTATGRETSLKRAEAIFNESVNKGLNRFISNFFNAFREFANNPESQATRTAVKEASRMLVNDFHRIHDQLSTVQEDVNFAIKTQVSQINGYVEEIASLNEKVQMVEIAGNKANDARDRRDLLVKKLSDLVNIKAAEGDNGVVTITAGNTGVLVSGSQYNSLVARNSEASGIKREGDVSVYFKNGKQGSELELTRELTGGQLGGAIHVRDEVINDLKNKVDDLAYTLHLSVNDIHSAGHDIYNNTGTVFFQQLDGPKGAAAKIDLNAKIQRDAGFIAGGLSPNAPGDNRVANAIASIQYKPVMKSGTSTMDEFYNGLVSEFAVLTKRNTTVLEQQKNIVEQLKNVRESLSGVSLDEEATDMIKYQKAFDASARVIRAADEMLDTVLNLKRL